MRHPKPWQIGKVDLDPPSDLTDSSSPRLSTIEIIDANEKTVCILRTHVQYIAREIVDAINEYDKVHTIKQCADCLYYVKDTLIGRVRCKFPRECSNKSLFERKDD